MPPRITSPFAPRPAPDDRSPVRGWCVRRSVVRALAAPADAHPVPFTFIDVRLQPGAVDLTLVAHIFDVAHDLGIQPQEQLLQPSTLAERGDAIVGLLRDRLQIRVDDQPLGVGVWAVPEPLPDRQSIRLRARFDLPRHQAASTSRRSCSRTTRNIGRS